MGVRLNWKRLIGQLAVVPARHVVTQIDQRFFALVHSLGLCALVPVAGIWLGQREPFPSFEAAGVSRFANKS